MSVAQARFITMADIAKFFSSEEKPVLLGEFQRFWQSLTTEEKMQYRTLVANHLFGERTTA